MNVCKKVILHYSAEQVEAPIVYELVKRYNMIPNILRAQINPEKEGYLMIELCGEDDNYIKSIDYLRTTGVRVEFFAEKIVWVEGNCTQCGACTGLCPSGALVLNRPEMSISFISDKCVACGLCLMACPVKALKLDF